MPLFKRDRYQRLDGGGGAAAAARRPPSSFCSSATIVFFVALCLVAAWMMASSNNIAVTVSPDNNKPAAKDQDFARSDRGGDAVSDTPQTGGQAGDAVRKDDVDTGGGVGTTQTRDEAGDGDTSEDGAGDSGKKDDGAKKEEPDESAGRKIAYKTVVDVTKDQSLRYADASGDNNPIHVDEGVAKAAGLPGLILQGLCTMAFSQNAIVRGFHLREVPTLSLPDRTVGVFDAVDEHVLFET